MDSYLMCVRCHGELQADHLHSFICRGCGAIYPTVDGVGIMVLNPDALLSTQVAGLDELTMNLQKRLRRLTTLGNTVSPESRSRLTSSFHGLEANLSLSRKLFKPVQEYLSNRQAEPNLLWFLSALPIGWSLNQLAPYFYRDWSGTKEANYIARLFTDAIRDYRGDLRASVAVLGAGAGGLLHRLSEFFTHSFGVDLSVSALLLAKRLMEGEEFDLHLNIPYDRFPRAQRQIKIRGPAKKATGVKLLAADVNNLPFPPSSLSCVITQYLMDIVPDQATLASQINRVLAPGGLWVNYGIPVGLTDFDLPNHLDLPWFLNRMGFYPIEISLKRSKHLDLSEISEWRAVETHAHAFFVARKNVHCDCQNSDPFAGYFNNGERGQLKRGLKTSQRLGVSISRKREYGEAEVQGKIAIEIRRAGEESFSVDVPDEVGAFLDNLFQLIGRPNSIDQIARQIKADYEGMFKDEEIMLVLKALVDSGLLLIEPSTD